MRPPVKHSPTVPIFSLYGEQDAGPGVEREMEFVHIELIATRSQRYGWEIASHAHRGLLQLLFVFGGGAKVRLDETSFDLHAPAALLIPPGVVHSFRFLPGTQGFVLTVAESLLSAGDAVQSALFEPLLSRWQSVDLQSVTDVSRHIASLLEQILDEFRGTAPGRTQMFDWLVRCVLLRVARRVAVLPLSGPARGRSDLMARFRVLVEAHFTQHWSVPRYAKALNLTQNRLNRLCQAVTGKSAFDLVQDRLLLEARRKLFYIAAPVSQLAYELGFSDPAYFCRFFKKQTGVAPSTFRRDRSGAQELG